MSTGLAMPCMIETKQKGWPLFIVIYDYVVSKALGRKGLKWQQ
jgi:hypothetical protein